MFRIAVFTIIFLAGAQAVQAQTADGVHQTKAAATIDIFHQGILDILKRAEELQHEGRARELRPIVNGAMDLTVFGARTVGRAAWNRWTAEQRETFIGAYRDYVCATYAARFSGFSGQEFVIVGERSGPRGQIIVESEVREPREKPIPIDYVMLERGGRWGIVDIYLDSAISEVALRRSEFSSVLRKEGFDGLLSAIQKKTLERADDG